MGADARIRGRTYNQGNVSVQDTIFPPQENLSIVPSDAENSAVTRSQHTVTHLGTLLSSTSKSKATNFLKTSVCASTAAQYAPDWKLWVQFHESNCSVDYFLRSIEDDDTARAIVWTLFIFYLYDRLGKRAEQVTGVLSGVRYHLLANLASVRFLGHEVVSNARRACRRNPEEHRVYVERRRNEAFLPATVDMLDNLRVYLWKDDDWSYDEILRKAIWLACCISFDRGPRISNLSLPSSKLATDHNIRCAQASFLVQTDEGPRTILAGDQMIGVRAECVASLTLDFVTSKSTGSGRTHQILPALISRRSERSSQLLSDFVAFVKHSGANGNEPLLSFYRTSPITRRRAHKTLRRNDVNSEIKACAVRCGLPPKYFSSISLRKGNATATSLGGLSAMERNVAGGWAPTSRVPDIHYDNTKRITGALDVASRDVGNLLNLDRLKEMVPAPSLERPSGHPWRHWGKGPHEPAPSAPHL